MLKKIEAELRIRIKCRSNMFLELLRSGYTYSYNNRSSNYSSQNLPDNLSYEFYEEEEEEEEVEDDDKEEEW